MTPSPEPAGSPVIAKRNAAVVGVASVYSAAVAYAVLLLAARNLDAADNAEFLVFWALLFGVFGVLTGISPEAARSAHEGVLRPRPDGAPIAPTALAFGATVTLVIGLSSLAWGGLVLPRHAALAVLIAAAGAFYSGHLATWGLLTGLRRWRGVAALVVAEATVRLAVVLAVVSGNGSLVALALASAVPAAVWLGAVAVPSVARLRQLRSDLDLRGLLRAYGATCAASAAGAALTVGYPVMISVSSSTPELFGAAGLMLGITFTRAPLLVPLTTYQGVALTYFLRHQERGRGALLPILALVAGIAAVGAAAAWLVGPWLFRVLLAGRYELSGAILAALVGAAGLLAMVTLGGMCCLAAARHGLFAGGWVVATAVAFAALFVPGDLTSRVLVSLTLGPAVGLAVQLVGLRGRRAPAEPATSTPPVRR